MKKILLTFFLIASSGILLGQQEPLFTQYRNNPFVINPAAAGYLKMHAIRADHRAQWLPFPGTPQTSTLSWNANIGLSGFGAYIFNDVTGPTSRYGLQGAYAFHLPLGEESYLSLGIAGKLMRYRLNKEIIFFQDPNDPAIGGAAQGIWVGDAAFGAFLYGENYYVGFSAPNLIQSDLNFGDDGFGREVIAHLYRHYFGIAGYKFDLDRVSLEPSIMVRAVGGAPIQVEGNLKVYVAQEQIWFGASYRSERTANLIFGARFDKVFHFTLSQGFSLFSGQRLGLGTSSQLTLGLDLPYKYTKSRGSEPDPNQ